MNQTDTKFSVCRGLEENLPAISLTNNGMVYFTTDTNKIFLYTKDKRLQMGGSNGNGNIVYASFTPEQEDEENIFVVAWDNLENSPTGAVVGSLIINDDGSFYKVIDNNKTERIVICEQILVSGNGTGSGTSSTIKKGQLEVTLSGEKESSILNGQECTFLVRATSGTEDDVVIDEELRVIMTYFASNGKDANSGQYTYSTVPYATDEITVNNGELVEYKKAAKLLRDTTITKIIFTVIGSDTNKFIKNGKEEKIITTNKIAIDWIDSKFSGMSYYMDSIVPSINMSTGSNQILDIYFDNVLVYTKSFDSNETESTIEPEITANSFIYDYVSREATRNTISSIYTHGRHTISAQLSLLKGDGKTRGASTPRIEREIALYLNEGYPLIWFGAMNKIYYEYDNPIVPIRVYDPKADMETAKVYVYIDGADALDGSYYTQPNSKIEYLKWTLTNLEAKQTTVYSVKVGEDDYETWEEVPRFTVEEDTRKMGIASVNSSNILPVNIDTRARSNSESEAKRKILKVGSLEAKLENFNWYNNGWIKDESNNTCLRISNGATVTLPIGKMTFAGNTPSHTIEMRFKVRNVQSYDKLITTYTRYKIMEEDKNNIVTPGVNKDWTDALPLENFDNKSIFDMFLAQRNTGYSSYDSYLAYILPILRETDTTIPTYDDLGFNSLYREYNLASAMLKYIGDESNPLTEKAICLGPQDGYFSNGTNAVAVDYVEDEMINLTIVYEHGDGSKFGNNKLMKFYLNGVLTSVARSTLNDSWAITANNLIINSSACDIDLYRFRIYNKALTLNEILKNIAYDNMDTNAWDLASLSYFDDAIQEYRFSFSKMKQYNEDNPDNMVMPYLIFTTDDSNKTTKGLLPYDKTIPVTADMEFVNPALDRAYAKGELNEKAEKAGVSVEDYYIHHCPSWKAENVTMTVQGTSSEFYPRKNFKAKTKINVPVLDENGNQKKDKYGDIETTSEYTMKLHKGPFADAYEANKDAVKAQKFFYYDNNTVGTNKFTLKVDFMESSGSYNMGAANMINTAYSAHPLADYGNGAFVKGTMGKATILDAYPASGEVWYATHKGKAKYCLTGNADKDAALLVKYGEDCTGDITCASAEDFAKGVWALATEQGQTKILGGDKKTKPEMTDEATMQANFEKNIETPLESTWDKIKKYVDKFLAYIPGNLTSTSIASLKDYRTSVQGFTTLAFYRTKSMEAAGTDPIFIGKYNLLLDKGAAEAYGFKLSGDIYQNYIDGNPPVSDIAECWEFENNSRGFCSFRDPWNRKDLKFEAPEGDSNALTAHLAPIVADYFEYRYNADDDYIDYMIEMDTSYDTPGTKQKLIDYYGESVSTIEGGRKKMLEKYSNWEKAVAWVWSTATDALIDKDGELVAVPNLGTYEEYPVAEALYESGKFLIEAPDGGHVTAIGDFNPETTYYKEVVVQGQKTYPIIKLSDDEEDVFGKSSKTFYQAEGNSHIIATEYDASQIYYILNIDTSKIDEFWKLKTPVTYDGIEHEFDTKEYRLAKFKAELNQHFNLEYLAAYFVLTETLECYDSRGKNCMMASWGPQAEGGDYIWYPIFYDIDTQLGINNTGIPSFEYSIDATNDGTFSTNDSVLWGNFFLLFKNMIIKKYEQLRGVPTEMFQGYNTDNQGTLNDPPFISVDNIENWYGTNPENTDSYSMKGVRPLLALNLDEQYKYITITSSKVNSNAPAMGAGYVATSGNVAQDTSDTYFYALQGNRSMSRKQFLTNRLNYIDSWLSVMNYKRNGENRIRSRISANSSKNTSDLWIEGNENQKNGDTDLIANTPYYQADGITKTHMFDGEYWLTMTPARKMYCTVGTDAANFKSVKYNGTPVKFSTPDLEKGIRQSGNYREQLYYVYGLDQMRSLGDMSKLYFQEFEMSGKISKMQDLLLGYDGTATELDEKTNEMKTYTYKNSGVNDWTIPAAAGSAGGGMPLLREVNLSNITFKNSNRTFDFSSCEKLENFRNTGSNIVGVTFADGVALDTLYLSSATTSLNLTEARKLTNLITDYHYPTLQNGKLVAEKGLYLEGLSEKKTNITSMDIRGGSLGYDSYKLLNMYLDACASTAAGTKRQINFNNVVWSPFVKVDDEAVETNNKEFYIDDTHFGLVAYDPTGRDAEFRMKIKNGMIYEKVAEVNNIITDVTLLDKLLNNSSYIGFNQKDIPSITGIIYINNADEIDEELIQTRYVNNFPGLSFFFASVKKGYSARFVMVNNGMEILLGTDKISENTFHKNENIFFKNPFTRAEDGETVFKGTQIDSMQPTKDFLGWAIDVDSQEAIVESYDVKFVTELGNSAIHEWSTLSLGMNPSKTDYVFYAVFDDRYFDVNFYDYIQEDNQWHLCETKKLQYNHFLSEIDFIPSCPETGTIVEELALEEVYGFVGWGKGTDDQFVIDNKANARIIQLSEYKSTQHYHLYACYVKDSVYNNVLPASLLKDDTPSFSTATLSLKPTSTVSGKITIPAVFNGKTVVGLGEQGFRNGDSRKNKITHVFFEKVNGMPNPNITTIGKECFQAFGNAPKEFKISLKYVEALDSIETILNGAFQNNGPTMTTHLDKALAPLNFSKNSKLRLIGQDAFNNCFSTGCVDTIIIPDTVEEIGSNAFTSNKTVNMSVQIGFINQPSHLISIGTPVFTKVKVTTVYGWEFLPENVRNVLSSLGTINAL